MPDRHLAGGRGRAGSNTHLMLNLQTIAESLNTKCGGRAWVFVASQEDMDKVVGDRTKQQGNDFSKIQARFKTRVHLTSADVEEVIRKRLLEKNDAGAVALREIYATESANFKTLFDFVDGAKKYRNYTDEEHFVGTYPFVSYQFPLFQAAIIGISEHNAFEGRNSSVGERSMLGVVQDVAKVVGTGELGTLATFDRMFEGIRASLKALAQQQILVAERNLDNELAIRLLKALFLVKYVESFQATARNLTVLVYDRFGLDLPALAEDVKGALAELERQTYIQRNGQVYEYLTNEEQVIEEEIKNVDIDSSEVSSQLFKVLSADVIKTNKVRYAKNGQDFPFGFKLDDQVHGQQKELSVHFITPDYPYTADETRMHSAGKTSYGSCSTPTSACSQTCGCSRPRCRSVMFERRSPAGKADSAVRTLRRTHWCSGHAGCVVHRAKLLAIPPWDPVISGGLVPSAH
ncbi:BREX system P-loop protein BrxC [Nocardioides sp. S5]|uniref:BREX system P-loop protein BrxC n=1 Tax=Nocardioides sp. S5 TaxID=2017486 RepID=UPI001A90AF98|nr:BREX system P-loop protein BrxC [Nocardioides sp. S5]